MLFKIWTSYLNIGLFLVPQVRWNISCLEGISLGGVQVEDKGHLGMHSPVRQVDRVTCKAPSGSEIIFDYGMPSQILC